MKADHLGNAMAKEMESGNRLDCQTDHHSSTYKQEGRSAFP